ncbi:MAG: protein-disulfide reductase DsbD domain-containing protein [Planctomycetota bacterium]|jgi:DsbC/DsbD-like thiol-disulfide interchange protein
MVAPPDGRTTEVVDPAERIAQAAAELAVDATSPAKPVALEAIVVPTGRGRAELVVKAQIHPGWHIYASVPPGQPYINTTFDVVLPAGVTFDGAWVKPATARSFTSPLLATYTGKVVFRRPLKLSPATNGAATVGVRYQACDARLCLPPQSVKLEVLIED